MTEAEDQIAEAQAQESSGITQVERDMIWKLFSPAITDEEIATQEP